jgi:hypothetical protein
VTNPILEEKVRMTLGQNIPRDQQTKEVTFGMFLHSTIGMRGAVSAARHHSIRVVEFCFMLQRAEITIISATVSGARIICFSKT